MLYIGGSPHVTLYQVKEKERLPHALTPVMFSISIKVYIEEREIKTIPSRLVPREISQDFNITSQKR